MTAMSLSFIAPTASWYGCVAELVFNAVVVWWNFDAERETAALRKSAQQGLSVSDVIGRPSMWC